MRRTLLQDAILIVEDESKHTFGQLIELNTVYVFVVSQWGWSKKYTGPAEQYPGRAAVGLVPGASYFEHNGVLIFDKSAVVFNPMARILVKGAKQ